MAGDDDASAAAPEPRASASGSAAASRPGSGPARARAVRDADAVVVGAGLAGLRAAQALVAGGASVLVVEARDRVGGRTLSQRVGSATFDLGGQWLGPTQDRLQRLVDALGLHTFDTFHAGGKLLELDGRQHRYDSDIPALSLVELCDLQQSLWRVAALARRVPLHDPTAARGALALDRATVYQWRDKALFTRDVRKMFDVAHRVVFGAEPEEVSMLQFLFYAHAGGGFRRLIDIRDGAQQRRFVDGAQRVSQRLAEALGDAVTLSSPVRAIAHGADGVTVTADAGVFRGRRAIVALPPPLARRIEFSPSLPGRREQLWQRMPMGSTAKVLVAYERAFWREAGLSGEVVAADGPLTVVFDNTSHDGAQPALVCFLCGRDGRAWNRQAEAERRDVVLAALARYFGAEALAPTAYVEKSWDDDPWTGGCPVSVAGPGVLSSFPDALRDPIGRLHFAGTETATEWNGYMEGALQSGDRAAAEVLARL